ncbi:MAG TPA: DegQ family serine endoprotease [Candidatus Binatia bacterium]|nr:DegQ family serine endoprotease [Candidatus Binatia bacterium]
MKPRSASKTAITLCSSIGLLFSLTWPGLSQVVPKNDQIPVGPAARSRDDFVVLAKKLGPAVVNISTSQVVDQPSDPFGGEGWERFFGQPFPRGPFRQQGLGSGFIIEPDGIILTNNHVVADAEKITVKLQDDREFEGKILGKDPKTDVAVIKIDAKNLPVVPLGDSDRLEVGEWVVALGSPFGLANTITAGIVSAKGRWIGAGPYDSFIQTDASINPGNSGGPLVNLRGEVVGMNTAIFSRTGVNIGIGFAIPVNLVKELVPELKSKGKITRGWLGVSIQQVTPDLATSLGLDKSAGALVSSVSDGSPAEKAGIKVGDVIIEYNGEPIKHSSELPILVARTDVGKSVPLKVFRGKEELQLTVTIAELKEDEIVASASKKNDLGLTVQGVTPEVARSLGLKDNRGVIITGVDPAGPGAAAGFRRGDVILEVDRKPIRSLADYEKAISEAKDRNLLFLVRRGDTTIFLALKS